MDFEKVYESLLTKVGLKEKVPPGYTSLETITTPPNRGVVKVDISGKKQIAFVAKIREQFPDTVLGPLELMGPANWHPKLIGHSKTDNYVPSGIVQIIILEPHERIYLPKDGETTKTNQSFDATPNLGTHTKERVTVNDFFHIHGGEVKRLDDGNRLVDNPSLIVVREKSDQFMGIMPPELTNMYYFYTTQEWLEGNLQI